MVNRSPLQAGKVVVKLCKITKSKTSKPVWIMDKIYQIFTENKANCIECPTLRSYPINRTVAIRMC